MPPSRSQLESSLRALNNKLLARLRHTEAEISRARKAGAAAAEDAASARAALQDAARASELARTAIEDELADALRSCVEFQSRASRAEALATQLLSQSSTLRDSLCRAQQQLVESEAQVQRLSRSLECNEAVVQSLTDRLERADRRVPAEEYGADGNVAPEGYVHSHGSASTSVPVADCSRADLTDSVASVIHLSSLDGEQCHDVDVESRRKLCYDTSDKSIACVGGRSHKRGCFGVVTHSILAVWTWLRSCVGRSVPNNPSMSVDERQHQLQLQQQRVPLLA